MKVQIYTLGCRLNKAESQQWLIRFQKIPDKFSVNRQVIIINSCSITGKADKETRQLLRCLRRENLKAFIVITGCWVENRLKNLNQFKIKELAKQMGINLLVRNKDKDQLVEKVIKNLKRSRSSKRSSEIIIAKDQFITAGRYFIKIQDGCDKFCTYCIVPFLRGRSQSVSVDKIVSQTQNLLKKEAREITLTGVDIAQWKNRNERLGIKSKGLAGLLKKLLRETEISRIRLGSIYPEGISKELLKLYVDNWPRLCRHFHIPIQSGCNRTLKRMNRRYTVEELAKILKDIRKTVPGVNITTDIIVGFPGETEKEFEQSWKMIKKLKFGKIHVFRFSSRLGTRAAKMEKEWGKVPQKIKIQRSLRIRKLSRQLEQQFKKQFIKKELPVLIEGRDKKGIFYGLSDNYLPVKIKLDSETNKQIGSLVNLKIQKIENEILVGKCLN